MKKESSGICVRLDEFRKQVKEYTLPNGELNDSAFRHIKADFLIDDSFGGIFDYVRAGRVCNRHKLKIAEVMRMLTFPGTLKAFVFRASMQEYLVGDEETFSAVTLDSNIMGAYVNDLLFRASRIGECYGRDPSPEELMRYSLTVQEYINRINEFYNNETLLINRMGYSDFSKFREAIIYTSGLRRNSAGNPVYAPISASLMNIKQMVLKLISREHFTLLHGRAGCGKTTEAIRKVPRDARVAVISLANNIAIATAAKLHREGIKADPVSNTAASIKFRKMNNAYMCSYNFLIIDEFSQYSLYEIRLLESILEYAVEKRCPVVIMGDELQIPSFLGRGSMLNSFLMEFPDQCEALTENHRSGDRGIVNLCEEFLNTETTEPIIKSAYLCDYRSLLAALDSGNYEGTMFVTGSHSCIRLIKYICCSRILGVPLMARDFLNEHGEPIKEETEANDFLTAHEQDVLMFLRKGGKLRVRATEKFQANGEGKPQVIHRNAPFIMRISLATADAQPMVTLTSTAADGKSYDIPYFKIKLYCTPDYAMTVNCAQGLEWDHVYVVMGNLYYTLADGSRVRNATCNRNLYEHEESVYVGLSRAKQTLHVFMGDTPARSYFRVPVINLFSESI